MNTLTRSLGRCRPGKAEGGWGGRRGCVVKEGHGWEQLHPAPCCPALPNPALTSPPHTCSRLQTSLGENLGSTSTQAPATQGRCGGAVVRRGGGAAAAQQCVHERAAAVSTLTHPGTRGRSSEPPCLRPHPLSSPTTTAIPTPPTCAQRAQQGVEDAVDVVQRQRVQYPACTAGPHGCGAQRQSANNRDLRQMLHSAYEYAPPLIPPPPAPTPTCRSAPTPRRGTACRPAPPGWHGCAARPWGALSCRSCR